MHLGLEAGPGEEPLVDRQDGLGAAVLDEEEDLTVDPADPGVGVAEDRVRRGPSPVGHGSARGRIDQSFSSLGRHPRGRGGLGGGAVVALGRASRPGRPRSGARTRSGPTGRAIMGGFSLAARRLCGVVAAVAAAASRRSIRPSWSRSRRSNWARGPRNSRRETSPSRLRSIRRNQAGPAAAGRRAGRGHRPRRRRRRASAAEPGELAAGEGELDSGGGSRRRRPGRRRRGPRTRPGRRCRGPRGRPSRRSRFEVEDAEDRPALVGGRQDQPAPRGLGLAVDEVVQLLGVELAVAVAVEELEEAGQGRGVVLVLGQLGLLEVAVLVGVGGLELGREGPPGVVGRAGAVVDVDVQADLADGDLDVAVGRAA